MKAFLTLSPDVWSVFVTVLLLLMLLLLYDLIFAVGRRASLRSILFSVVLLAVHLLLLVPLLAVRKTGTDPASRLSILRVVGAMPWVLPVAVILILLALSLLHTLLLHRWSRRRISSDSIKEYLDNMPMGLCFFLGTGQLLLVNRVMDTLCRNITGGSLLNGTQFWQVLGTWSEKEDVLPSEMNMARAVRLPDGSFWTFIRKELRVQGEPVTQVVATDTTQLHQLGAELRSRNRQLTELNERLRQYSENVTVLTREEEVLAAKVNIHDELGQALLASRAWIENTAPADEKKLLNLWRQNVALFRQEARGTLDTSDPLQQIRDAAAAVGVEIIPEGEMPWEDETAMRLLFAAARECLTNAVAHAAADTMTIRVRRSTGGWTAAFTNDGTPPEGPVTEGGGLSGLRRRVEQAGGTMKIDAQPTFVLTLFIPGGEEERT